VHVIVSRLERATHVVGVYLERELAQAGIGQAEAHVLARLGAGEATSPGELHRLFGHKRSTITSVLDRLEARGLIERRLSPGDRRSLIVSLTDSGRVAAATVTAVVERLEAAAAAAGEEALAGFSATIAALEAEAERS